MFNVRGETSPQSNSVVIIDIDEKSLKNLGQWPWSRDKLSKILENLHKANVAIIGLDIVFAEADRTSPHKILKKYNIKKENLPNYDLQFAQTIASTPTILGYQFEFKDKNHISKEAPSIQTIFIEKNKNLGKDYLIQAQGTILNIPIIQNNSYSSGFFNNIPDEGGIIRSIPMIISYEDSLYPSLSLEILRIALGIQKVIINYDENGVENIHLDNYKIQTDRFGRVLINFRGKEKTFTYISALDIYNNSFSKKDIENKIALVGTSAAALMDLRATPFESVFPGVEVHANAIDNILNQDYLFKPSWILAVNILFIFLIVFINYILIKKIAIVIIPIYFLGMTVLIFYLNYYLLFKEYLVINTLFPILALIFSSASSLILDYFFEVRKKEEIKNKFASKVSKDVMEQLINNTDKNQLQSQNKNITIFFSDIRQFTSISEKIGDPKILVNYLNHYLTPMSEIITKNNGTIDKYIGDAIMAYWNAPFDIENHADKAVKTAIEQINILDNINKYYFQNNLPKIEIGIGITTGSATIGEIGSIGRSDYTVIGDTINLGSRIESLCKYYGVKIIISEFTKDSLKEPFNYRFLDFIKVKGKNDPVRIWEILHDKQNDREMEKYDEGLKFYYEENFQLSSKIFKELSMTSSSKIYQIYLERSNFYIQNPNKKFERIFIHNEK